MEGMLAYPRILIGVRGGVAVGLALTLLSMSVRAQVLYGSLVGTVTDSSGLAVPGASVTITQAETNQSREATTNATGAYIFPNLAAGTYQVDVALTGFQSFRARDIVVRQNTAVRVDARLSIGTLQESVEVSAAAAILQTESAAVQSQTTSLQIETLPTSGRSFHSLLVVMPGVGQPDYFQSGGINNPARSMTVSVNGQPATNTVFRIDGVSATNQWIQQLQSYSPSMEAIETVSVVTNSFDADLGMAGGASVNVQVKSGTNTLRGSAFEYWTDARLRARNFFLPAENDKGIEHKHVFGGTNGGPIVRNKLFYFFSVESTRQTIVGGQIGAQTFGSSGFQSLPPAALRAGDFSATGTVLYDPRTGNPNGTGRIPFAFANCPGVTSATDPRFASCNVIPSNRINPISRRLLDMLVLPTLPGYANNYFSKSSYQSTYHKIDSKITWTPANKLNLNARMSYLPDTETSVGIYPRVDGSKEINPLSLGRQWDAQIASGSLAATSILSPTFVVDGVVGFTRQHTIVVPVGPDDKCWGDEFLIPNACQPPYSRDRATPRFDMTGWSQLGDSPMRDYIDPQVQMVGNAGWTRGSHNVKFGVDVHRLHMNHYETSVPQFVFNGGSTALNGGASPNNFNSFADFLLGMPFSRSAQAMSPLVHTDGASQEQPATLRSWEFGMYLRDQWQLSPKMTASVGLRWEYYPMPRRADRGLEVFDFTTNRLQICGVAGANEQVCDIKIEKDLFTPRLGLAYRPAESVVVRVGFSRNPQNDNSGRVIAQAFPAIIAISQVGPNTFTSVGSLSDGVPVVPQVDLASGSVTLPAGAGVTTHQQQYVRGHITSYNVTAQKLFPHALSVQIGYVANRQNKITRNQNLNYGQIGGGAASQPYRALLGTTSAINVPSPLGRVKYDSLQLSVNRRMTNGLQLDAGYSYAKATDWWASSIAIPEFWHLNKGQPALHTPHKFVLSTIYELPFGPGKTFLTKEGILGKLVGRWQLNTFFTATSGTPFSISANAASLNAPGSAQRADQVKDTVEILGGIGRNSPYFDVTAFRPVTEARFGTAGVNTLRGPSVVNLDASIFRTFAMKRGLDLQFRLEVFNVTNTPHFANPSGTNVSNLQLNPDGSVRNLNGFGVITSTQTVGREYDERHFRLGMRLSF